ncbi:DUF2180 family protein [Streptomyces sp. NPDC002851]
MNCYDCSTEGSTTMSAVALCHCCGSALCPEHLQMTRQVLHQVNGMGVSHGPSPARLALCGTCHAAQPTNPPATSSTSAMRFSGDGR